MLLLAGAANAQLPDFTGLVEDAGPSVVSVMATSTAKRTCAMPQRADEDAQMQEFFRRFFGQPGMPGAPGAPQAPRDRTSQGTGFIISADDTSSPTIT